MLIVGVLCVAAAVVSMTLGVRTLIRPRSSDPEQLVLRAIAPAQLAVGVILGAGGAVAIAGPPAVALLAVFICVTGALGILAAGSWLGARYAARLQEQQAMQQAVASAGGGCGGDCGCAGAAPEPDAAPVAVSDAVLGSIMLSGASASAGGGCGDGCGCGCASGSAAPAPQAGCGDGCGCG